MKVKRSRPARRNPPIGTDPYIASVIKTLPLKQQWPLNVLLHSGMDEKYVHPVLQRFKQDFHAIKKAQWEINNDRLYTKLYHPLHQH
ncbi:TPA: hypothetical protein U2I12_000720 [Citrobacter farmeri]|uniref:hypothetical protein n=1 Tax=Citrobacter farmeri TaxID=67824 RepID=UPI000F6821E9|nr:hypothetical protein [Citrobacter farmeri]HEM6628077.1 hypothetical protein [Citrobacter farmeri]